MCEWFGIFIFVNMNQDEKVKAAARIRLTNHLTQHKLRKTQERYAILDKIYSMSEHVSVDDVFKALEDDSYHMSKATIYNTMELLVDAGLVLRHNFSGQQAIYEKSTGISDHLHLICSQCGNIREIKDNSINKFLTTQSYGKFQPLYADLHIYGICPRCRRKSKNKFKKLTEDQTKKR